MPRPSAAGSSAWAIAGARVGGIAVVVALGAARARAPRRSALLPPVFGVAGAVLAATRASPGPRERASRGSRRSCRPCWSSSRCACRRARASSTRCAGSSEVGAGELTGELRAVVSPSAPARRCRRRSPRCAGALEIPALSRSVDQLVAAIDRGAPLAQVLHAQALDAREDAKRGLIERAGRKEIYMLVPLVFLILPLSVLFAVFPGIFMLRLGIG